MTDLPELFPGFEARSFTTGGAEIFARIGGSGPPLLLLHGYPQTHACWHKIAPRLAEAFTLVLPDLRGYGSSSCPLPDQSHSVYAKRAMAQDMVEVMAALGHERFRLVGHDRGARVAYRLALDHGARVERLAVLDIVPTADVWNGFDAKDARGKFHWTFLAQAAPLPEAIIEANPVVWHEALLARWSGSGEMSHFSREALAHYRAFFTEPERIMAMCEDYRAGATVDYALDEADREAGRRIACPTLAIWGGGRAIGTVSGANPLDIWRGWCTQVTGHPLPCGHFLAEEAPGETLSVLLPFLQDA